MPLFARKPKRTPHPDAAVEAQLRAILSLQQMAARRDDEIGRLGRQLHKLERRPGHGTLGRFQRSQDAQVIRGHLADVEDEAHQLHEEIAKAIAALPDQAVLWLRPGG